MAVTVRIKAVSESKSGLRAKVRGHEVVVDEPAALGGKDQGPNPVEYMLVALAGCLNIIGHMVAGEMGITLRSAAFEVEGSLDPAGLNGKDETVRAGYQRIEARVKVESDADAATLERWLRAVERRCPVSDNLAYATPVTISLASA